MDEQDMKKIFDWPEDVPISLPKFSGQSSPEPKDWPNTGGIRNESGSVLSEFFNQTWHDVDGLGISVFVQETVDSNSEKDERAVSIVVVGYGSELSGKTVVVGLLGEENHQQISQCVVLERDPESNECRGKGSFGSTKDVQKKVGKHRLTISAYLLTGD